MRRLVVIAVFAFLALPAHAAWAGSGGNYVATYTTNPPTIDGSLSDSAWAFATPYSVTLANGSSTIPATARFLRDGTNLYVGVTINDSGVTSTPSLSTFIDNAGNGSTNPGDDLWIDGSAGAQDYFAPDTTGNGYTNDTGAGGTNDTTAAISVTPGATVSFEVKHPLCSSDTSHDVCVTSPNQVVGVDFQYEPDTNGVVFYGGPGTRTDQSTFANLTVPAATDTTPPTAAITSPAAGSTLSGIVHVTVNAADNVGVDHVIYRYNDGSTVRTLGTVSTPPFSFDFDTATVPNCAAPTCTLYVQAVDAAGNTSGGSFGDGIGVGVQNSTWNLASELLANAKANHTNPFGPWEMLDASGVVHDPTTYRSFPASSFSFPCSSSLAGWHSASSAANTAINIGSSTISGNSCAPNATYPPGVAVAHPGATNLVMYAWHSPISGTVSIAGGMSDLDPGGGNGISWSVDLGATTLASGTFGNGGSATFPAGLSASVTGGSTLYFVIDPNGDFSFDSTEVDATITATSLDTAQSGPSFTVNSLDDHDDGTCGVQDCTLREAINAVNAAGGGQIAFNIPGGAAPKITLESPLPAIRALVSIAGTTQPGTPAGTPGVTLVPGPLFNGSALIDLAPGSGQSTVSGLAFGGNATQSGGADAIDVQSDGNTISGNWIGVGADSKPLGLSYYGIDVTGNGNTIGGSVPVAANLIVGDEQQAIAVQSANGDTPANGNVIQGNLIGLNPDGTPAAGIGNGISIDNSTGTVIGSNVGPSGLANVVPLAGNVISGMGDAIRILDGSSGTVVAGNYIGVDRSGAPTGVNARGIVVTSSNNQLGPGNTIAHTVSDGINVTGGRADRIVANSIFDSGRGPAGGQGITLGVGGNDNIPAPVITSFSESTVSGTFAGQNPAFIEVFVNGSCGSPFANGAGQIYETFVTTAADGTWSAALEGLKPTDGITVTATQPNLDTSQFSNCTTSAGGLLGGSVNQSIVKPVDVTAAGTTDWAVWGQGLAGPQPNALPPTDSKVNGGRQISDLSLDNPGSVAPRGFGTDGTAPFTFSWSDGTPLSTASGVLAGLTAPSLGSGLSFTVPADTTPRTLTIWTSAHYADGRLTAHLSDGSAADYVQTIHAVQGDFATTSGENAPAIFTIHYQAASAGQHLTISWDETANNNCANCDDIVLYAAALSGGGNATGTSASFSSGPSVQMSGTVPISNIPLAAFDPQPPGAPPITLQNAQLGQTQLGHTQLGHTQLGHTQLGQTQLGHTQLGQTQLGHTQLGHTQLGQTQLGHTQLGQTQLGHTQLGQTQLGHTQLAQTGLTLDQVPLDPTEHPNGWQGLLAGTTLAGLPLQTISLGQVFALTSPPNPQAAVNAIQSLTFADVDLQASTLGQITMDSLTLGDSLINQLGGQLQTDIETQLNAWCMSVALPGDTGGFCTGSDPGIGYFTLIQLGLIGAPVDTLQLGHTQLGQTQLGHTQLGHTPVGHLAGSASGIVGMQLSKLDLTPGLGISGLQIGGLPSATVSSLFNCSNAAVFDCTNGTLTLGAAQAAGAIKPTTLVGDLDVGDFLANVTIGQLLDSVRGPLSAYKSFVTFGDVVGLLLRSSDVDWESLQPDLLTIFDPNRNQLSMSAGFSVAGTGTPPADVKIDLPAGFDFVPGSASLNQGDSSTPLADPTITDASPGPGIELAWHLDAVTAGASYTISFKAFAGTTVGPTQATETVSAGGHASSSTAAFSVTDSFTGQGTSTNPIPIDTTPAHDTVEMSTLPTAGAVDYYHFPMPPAGTRISVHLTDLPADYDLALYSPTSTSVRTGATSAPPLQDGIVPDQPVNLTGTGNSGQLTPTGLEDIPNPGIPLIQLSDNRHQDEEDVGMVSPGGGGYITVAVFGYNGAFSPQAYTLRVREAAPTAPEVCTARSFPNAGAGTTPTPLPNLSALPANLNTIILVDEKRLGDTYGATDEANAVAKLTHLAGDNSLGVNGIVVPVESIPQPGGTTVQSLYDTWDSNPCDPNAANAVANAIANEVSAIAAARPSVKYVVFGGGDDQIPFFRMPDLSLIANENGFAGQFSNNEYEGALAAGDLLSDDPYLDTNPVPASGQQLFPPNLSGGRLVETAQDIANAVTAFETAPTPGALKSSTGFVSGYDFVADGSQSVARNLSANGVSVQTLIDDPLHPLATPWGSNELLTAAFPTAGPANVNSWNGHYDNYRAQMDNGQIIQTSDLPTSLNNGIFFTMGCHAGFQTTDAVVGSSVLDWPQYFSEHNTGFVGNTGFGLGETDSVAFSEELMADFAGQLNGSVTLGQALEQAKQQYYLSRVAFSNYDTKALSEAELYGLPMYGVGHAPTAVAAAASAPLASVIGTSSSTSPSTGSLSPFSTGVQSAPFSASPTFTEQDKTDGDFFTNAGQVQAPNYRPLQPYVSLPAARSGLVAHGVVIDGLTSTDMTLGANGKPWVPDNVRPTLNSGAAEPPPTFTDEAWPEKIPTLVSLGANQSLNLITGQFFTQTGSGTTGVERLWTQIGGRVTYSTSQDFTPPTIDSMDAFLSGGVVAFSGHFSDLDQNGNPGQVVFAQVVYDDGAGHWTALPLQHDATSGLWSGGAPFAGSNVQFFVEACDAAGNCGYSSNKGRYFDAAPLPSGSSGGGGLTLTPSGPQSGQWFTGPVSVTATTNSGPASMSADGGQASGGPVTLTGDGAHVVDATDAGGNTATGVYLIDTTGPTVTHTIAPASPDGTNGWYVHKPTVTFSCTDNLSGVKTCSGPATLNEGASQGATGTGVDNAGNVGHDVVSGIKVDVTPPTTPTISGISPQLYPINSLPAQSAISCASTDATAGLNSCVVSGYSAAVGAHTLTATATDNAGNTSTSTLTYTVGFQAGMVLAPVTAPKADQTSPSATDLQVFKIKSTIPLKFQFYLDSARTTLMTTPPAGSIARLVVTKHDATTDSIIATELVTAPADTGNQFRWTGAPDYQYVYNTATSSLTAGTYGCQITLYAADGTTVLGQSLPQYFVLRS